MSVKNPDTDWLVQQLPDSIKWGSRPVQITFEGAPKNVKAALVRLDRANESAPIQNASTAIVKQTKPEAELTIPKEPNGPISAGTYRIDWVITFSNKDKEKGSKVYHELETYQDSEAKSLEKEAYARALAESEQQEGKRRRK